MSTMFVIGFFIGLFYIFGIVLTFRRWARELDSTPWLVAASLLWPVAWFVFGCAYLCMLEEWHIRIEKAWRNK